MCKDKIDCPQCELLIRELAVYKRKYEENKRTISANKGYIRFLRLKTKEMTEELQKLEERLQEEVNYSSTLSETIKELGE